MGFDPDAVPEAVWGVPFEGFVGPHRIDDRLYGLDGTEDDREIHFGADIAPDPIWRSADGIYAVHAVADPDWQPQHTVLLTHGGDPVGFYAGGMTWIDPDHRGRGLAAPMILAAAVTAGGVPYDNVEIMGFSEAGIAAHRAAHRMAVEIALAAGKDVPPGARDGIALLRTPR